MGDNARAFPHPLYERYVLQPFYTDAQTYYYAPMLAANKAHVVMLYECGIITKENAQALLKALAHVESVGLDGLDYQSGVEDLFFTIENALIQQAGAAYGGNLQLARSRNDLGYALTRMALRPLLLQVAMYLNQFRTVLHTFAQSHLHTLMPGYTHTQPAQPTTMAHYITGILSVMARDYQRLRFAYETNNQSPLGAAALTGTGFPINRERIAGLLGFDSVMHSTYDSIGASDNLTDVANLLNSQGANLSRFTRDLLFWATQESGAIRIHDSFIQISSIMPQKRNPVVLEHLRARISRMMAQANGVIVQCHNIPFGDTQDIEDEIFPMLFGGLHTASDILHLYAAVIETLHVNVEHLRKRATAGFTTVTELADTLVREAGLSFRQAHTVVSGMVTHALGNSLSPDDLTTALLDQIAQERIGQPVNLSQSVFKQVLDPQAFVNLRTVSGGAAPSATQAVLDSLPLAADMTWLANQQAQLAGADQTLNAAVQEIIG